MTRLTLAERRCTPAGALQSDTTSEDVKGAAALALGGVAVGNLGAYLPALLTAVRGAVSAVCTAPSCVSTPSLFCSLRFIVTIRQALASAPGCTTRQTSCRHVLNRL